MGCPECDNCDGCDDLVFSSGQDGEDGKRAYIAYADDSSGNGFDLNDSTKDYVSIVVDDPGKTNDKSLHSGNWHFWGGPSASATNGGILFQDDTSDSTTTTSLDIVPNKSYTMPSGTMDNNGDALRIKAAFKKDASVNEEVDIQIRIFKSGNTSSFYTSKVSAFYMTENDSEGILDIQLNRVDNTTASADTLFQTSAADTYQVTNTVRFFDDKGNFSNTLDFDGTDTEIEVRMKTSSGSTPIICDHSSVELIETTV